MSTEQMRSEFEVSFAERHKIPVRWVSDCWDGNEYLNETHLRSMIGVSEAWYFWHKSRAELVVELPGGFYYPGCDVEIVTLEEVKTILRAAGITVKEG